MTFSVPWALTALLLVPLVLWWYLRLLATQRDRRAELARTGLVPVSATGSRSRWRHVGPALLLAAMTVLLIGTAGPAATITTLKREGTVILAFDVSNSMRATDVEPTRMDAAKAAARAFIERQPSSVRIGIVAFSDSAIVTQPPTADGAEAIAALDRLTPNGGTSLGQGIFTSLKAIAGGKLQVTEQELAGNPDDINIGYYGSAAIVMLSDGQNTAALDPVKMAQLASVAGVRIDTVGLGSPDGATVTVDGVSQQTALDEAMLTKIADTTDGTYQQAADPQTLASIYRSINLKLTARKEPTEITSYFTLVGMALLLAGAATSLLRTGRVIAA